MHEAIDLDIGSADFEIGDWVKRFYDEPEWHEQEGRVVKTHAFCVFVEYLIEGEPQTTWWWFSEGITKIIGPSDPLAWSLARMKQ